MAEDSPASRPHAWSGTPGESGATSGASDEEPTLLPGVLSAATIRTLLAADPPLIEPLDDPAIQIQPNGVDLTLDAVWWLESSGTIGLDNVDRRLPERRDVPLSDEGQYLLAPGPYLVRFRETVALPADVMALGRPRSSLARCGAALHTAVWDAGYRGRSEALLVVYNAGGLQLRPGARILQLVFLRLDRPTERYSGYYQGENLGGA
ncbi:MAG: deoxyuridine 5'-triphosphate nucleotidohydrolase [Chloroflexi bacterium]|nr:deoxyuridine 5'-triphosphate nucleotidohydrolase [Chloroflexota bacterium]